jgi:hypothetical protein
MSGPHDASDDAAALDPPRASPARGVRLRIALAAAAHLAVLGLSAHAASASGPEHVEIEQAAVVRSLLVHAEEADLARDQAIFRAGGKGNTQGNSAPRAGDGRAKGGQEDSGVAGKMGERDAPLTRRGQYALPEPSDNDRDPSVAREGLAGDTATFGVDGSQPTGLGRSAGGNDSVGGVGHLGHGAARPLPRRKPTWLGWREGPPEPIQRVIRQSFGRFRLCYENGLRNDPNLQGRVGVRFVIGRDGSVASVMNGGSDLPDAAVVSCVIRAFSALSFPQPERGPVTISYPMVFSPGA